MFQLTLDGGAVATDEFIYTLAEEYGRITDLAEFERLCAARGAWVGISIDDRLHNDGMARLRRIFKKKPVGGLRRMIYADRVWMSRAICTKTEHKAFCRSLYGGINADVLAFNSEIQYHFDRWDEWPEQLSLIHLPEEGGDYVDDDPFNDEAG